MDLLIITGFLGSGKTTFLRCIADRFAKTYPNKKMAVIENEVGKIGIDGGFISENGLVVREINSGCICCGLRIDFLTTLIALERDFAPDLVILEPSGVAGPLQVVGALCGYGGEISSKRVMSIIDASRIQNIPDMTIPIITDGINVADFVVINKIDLVSENELANIRNKVLKIRPDAVIIETSAVKDVNVQEAVDKILDDKYFAAKPLAANLEKPGEPAKINAVVFAKDYELNFDENGICSGKIGAALAQLLHKIAARLKAAGCTLIGHIKAVVKADTGGCVFVSTTSFEDMPHIKGAFTAMPSKGRLIINVIVYDVKRDEIEKIVCGEMNNFLC